MAQAGVALSVAWGIALAAWLHAGPASAQEGTGRPGGTTGASQAPPATCETLSARLNSGDSAARLTAAEELLRQNCHPVPPAIVSALREGRWDAGTEIVPSDRARLASVGMQYRFAGAETLAVAALEEGQWPDGEMLDISSGAVLLRGLKYALTPYRVNLLLDIYDQREHPLVRSSVIQALDGATAPEALLPVLDAYFHEEAATQAAAIEVLSKQPEGAPTEVLARVIRHLPKGRALEWAVRLAREHPTPQLDAAVKERGL